MIKIAICDDEPIFVEKIEKLIKKEIADCNDEWKIFAVNSGDELLQLCFKEKIEVIFLDIAMPEFDGFEVAKKLQDIRKDILLVFVSSKEDKVYDSYDYSPIWFIPKRKMDLIKNVMKKIINKIHEKESKKRFVQLQIGNRIVEIDIDEVKYFKTDGHYINFIERNGVMSNSYRCRLADIKEQLDSVWFVQTHNRFLVNLRMVSSISSNELVLKDKERIPISRARMSDVRDKFQDYLRSIR